MKILPLILAAISALLPVISQRSGLSEKYGFKMKMLCAFMYLATGALSASVLYNVTNYSLMILGALTFGILGDFFLEYNRKKFFPLGAAFFALGHIVYSYTFLCIGDYRADIIYVAVITAVLTAAVMVFAKTKLRLKGKKNLLLIYAPVLIFAFACTFVSGTMAARTGNLSFGLCLIFGGALFLASDIMIGLGKGGFERPQFLRNAVSYTYFAAQTLFALSIYFQ